MHPLLVLANKITFTHKNYPMIMKHKFLLILTALLPLPLLAQETAIAMDHEDEVSEMFTSIDGVTIQEAVRATQKHGLHWCMMPFLTYSEQLGFTGKVAGSLFDFGNAGNFPNYDQLIYGELSYSTRRAGTLRAYYDSKKLIENFKFDADITFQPDALYDFYGFNGYASNYDYYLIQPFYNENYYIHDNPDYISSTFYRMKRNYLRAAADIRGIIKDSLGLFWHAGLGLQYYSVGHVDIERYNRGKAPMDQLPDTITLYDQYVNWGLITPAEANGGWHPYIHAGASIDSRDRAINPHRGFYGDLFLTGTFGFGDLSGYTNLKVNFNWKHHVTLWEDVVTLAYMVGGQINIVGDSPFYLNGTINQLLSQRDMYEGVGGENLPRGMLRNRLLGKGFDYASIELRTNLLQFKVGKEQLVLSLNPFLDEVMLLQPCDLQGFDENPATADYFSNSTNQYVPHFSVGCGARVTVSNYFVVSCDWAMPLKEQDNNNLMNLYFTVGYLF